MKKEKRWILFTLLISILIPLLINIISDPYGVFGLKLIDKKWRPWTNNIRHLKINKILKEKNKYDSFLIGSSRIGLIEPELMKKYLPKARFYNLYFPAADQRDNSNTIAFLSKVTNIKNIILLVNLTEIDHYNNQNIFDLLNFKHHYKVTGENFFVYYIKYLLPKWSMILKTIKLSMGKIKTSNLTSYIQQNQGTWNYKTLENYIMKYGQYYFERQFKSSYQKPIRREKGILLKSQLKALKKIKMICSQKNINLIVFVPPHHARILDKYEIKSYLSFLKGIAMITPFWNFSGYNSVTLNKYLHYDKTYFRYEVAQMILDRIFNKPNSSLNDDFGFYVTKANVDDYLIQLEKEIEENEY